MIGRLAHWGSTIVLTSAVLAGVKHSTGFAVKTSDLPEGIARTTADQLLGVGERFFDTVAGISYTSGYFERETKAKK